MSNLKHVSDYMCSAKAVKAVKDILLQHRVSLIKLVLLTTCFNYNFVSILPFESVFNILSCWIKKRH